MKIGNFVRLALVLFIALEGWKAAALEMPWEYELPFKIPFGSISESIHRSFPLRVKYTREHKDNSNPQKVYAISGQQSWKYKAKTDGENPLRTKEPNAEMTKQPVEITHNRDSKKETADFNTNTNGYEKITPDPNTKAPGDEVRPSLVKHEDSKELPKPDKKKKEDTEEDNSEEDSSEEDSSEDDEDEDEEEDETGSGEPETEETTTRPEPSIPVKFPYRLIIQVMNPKGEIFHKKKTGYISELQEKLFRKHGIFHFLRSLRHLTDENVETDFKQHEKKDEIPYPKHVVNPVLRYSRQRMDQKGNLYRQDKVIPFPVSIIHHFPKNYKILTPSDRYKHGIQRSSRSFFEQVKRAIRAYYKPTEQKPVDNHINEIEPSKNEHKIETKDLKYPQRNYGAKVEYKSVPNMEKEIVLKEILIRPAPRIIHESVELPKRSMDVESTDVPLNSNDAGIMVISSGHSRFSLKHVLAPIRNMIMSKLFGQPTVLKDGK